ncbi:transglutaminase family protein [Methylibium petroleiphilum]|uniref:transglutaminase family protein n=1 Tax=Methylibium petroleiphilum TaxID=105560 RepID=UPI001ACD1244|nr:transglutaminase family protein [Methylibium petroleiphilum]MBN9205298.1 transglutaminase family protein [Methylibium petroleiphilum]
MNSIFRSEPPAPLPRPADALHGPVELEVVHVTEYRYSSPVELAQHIAVLRPRDDATQQLLGFEMEIEPAPAQQHDDRDVYGNRRRVFTLTASHQHLRVCATSRVRAHAVAPSTAAALPWEACRAHWRYESGRPLDAAVEFTFPSTLVPHHAALRDWALPSFPPGRGIDEAATELMHRLHADFTYAPLSTEVGTPVLQAFEQRRGVCQDFAHVMIGSLRALGLSARYVSGYLLTEPPPGQPVLQGADASHAWVAVAVPREDGSTDWLELDPTNDCEAGLTHVRLALGRDYADVTPLCGVIRGGGRHQLDVRVGTRVVPAA